MAARPGFEPELGESKSPVLPLHHRAVEAAYVEPNEIPVKAGKTAFPIPDSGNRIPEGGYRIADCGERIGQTGKAVQSRIEKRENTKPSLRPGHSEPLPGTSLWRRACHRWRASAFDRRRCGGCCLFRDLKGENLLVGP